MSADATSLVERFMSTTKLHERIYAPYGQLNIALDARRNRRGESPYLLLGEVEPD